MNIWSQLWLKKSCARISLEGIYGGGTERPRAHSLSNQDIQLCICTSLGFKEKEEAKKRAQKTKSSPEEPRLPFPVPGGWVEHVGDDDRVHDTENIVQGPGYHEGFGAEACRGDLRYETYPGAPTVQL